jgi:hypothetical protein
MASVFLGEFIIFIQDNWADFQGRFWKEGNHRFSGSRMDYKRFL